MKKNIKIDFWGIGAQKSGTTWLYKQLMGIPEFDLPPIKELHYFDRNPMYPSPSFLSETLLIKRLSNFKYVSHAIKTISSQVLKKNWKKSIFFLRWYFSNYTDNWYLSLFKIFNGYKGEISPSYSILKEQDIRRMYRLSPDAKLILILRNPIERAWSHFRFNTRKDANFSLENTDEKEIIKFMESQGQLLRSNYIRTINNFSKVFPKTQILICFYDAISEKPDLLLNDIIKFISADAPISISHLELKNVVNKSKIIDCPKNIENYLKDKYYTQIKQLAEKYGGYFNKWYEETYGEESLIENRKLSPTMVAVDKQTSKIK